MKINFLIYTLLFLSSLSFGNESDNEYIPHVGGNG
jgi:hypothetical protein